MTSESQSAFGSTRNARLSRRLHDVTWGLLLLMTGVGLLVKPLLTRPREA